MRRQTRPGRLVVLGHQLAAGRRQATRGPGRGVRRRGCDDIVRDIYITGGMPSAFIPAWLSVVNLLKWLPNPSTLMRDMVRNDALRWASSRVKSPATEMGSIGWGFLTARDPRIHDDPYFDERDPRSIASRCPRSPSEPGTTCSATAPPASTSASTWNRACKQMVVGDGYHFDAGSGYGGDAAPPRLDVLERAWFDRWLKGHRNGVEYYGPVTMLQQGGAWTSGQSFHGRA